MTISSTFCWLSCSTTSVDCKIGSTCLSGTPSTWETSSTLFGVSSFGISVRSRTESISDSNISSIVSPSIKLLSPSSELVSCPIFLQSDRLPLFPPHPGQIRLLTFATLRQAAQFASDIPLFQVDFPLHVADRDDTRFELQFQK
ncbi:Uncharacterized protein APZ42_018018 [Daphnia magna]|uniref:Uncharacterized protein n=1 Tax=Daphnia magna TaxID=35525 RepID=A0A162CJ00_9CRUS|nr:Uncharacterized protein APZ42_018018 [Daphnia magna]